MARKARTRVYASAAGRRRQEAIAVRRRRRMKFLAGGVVLLLVLGIGGLIRWRQQQEMLTQLQSGGSGRYTRGPVEAPVVIKEFSDYT